MDAAASALIERLACKEPTPNGGWYWFTDAEIVAIRKALEAQS